MKRFSPSDLPAEADLLVIGGGITGASVARDAALRGLSVVLVERDDFASGTSSRSSKLIHGGLRYLQTYQFRMVHESVRERETMMRVAPHLADLQPFMYLLYDGYPEGKALLNLGLTFYDAFSRAPLKRRHRMIGRDAVLRREPHLNPTGLKGAGLYQDALTDDARLVIDVLQSAAQAGALLANHREVTGLIREHGRITGAEITDRLTDEHITVRARTVVNAAGPWVDRVLGLEQAPQYPTLRPTKGVHIVLRTEDFPCTPPSSCVLPPTPVSSGRPRRATAGTSTSGPPTPPTTALSTMSPPTRRTSRTSSRRRTTRCPGRRSTPATSSPPGRACARSSPLSRAHRTPPRPANTPSPPGRTA